MRVRYAVVLLLAPLTLLGSAGAESPATGPTALASATAIRIIVPGLPAVTTQTVTAPPASPAAAGQAYAYPADGSVVSAQSTLAAASTKVAVHAGAGAEANATAVSLLGGVITAETVTAASSAGTGYSSIGGNQDGSSVTNLQVGGKPVGAGVRRVTLGDWGTLLIGATTIDRTAPDGTQGYRGTVVELDVKLTAAYGGLPAGSEIQVGSAEAAVQTAPAPPTTVGSTGDTTTPDEPPLGDRPQDRPRMKVHRRGPHEPLKIHPKLTAGRYVFPAYGASSYIDTFGSARSDVTYHHGDDIFGELGQPLLAVADGTIFSVGWNKIGGNRLWLLDQQGNQFYYAHLSAFSTLAVDGAHVRAGQVIGFMGNTGDAEGTPVHLHFEIHPVSLLYLGYDGAVDPTAYLDAWQHQRDLPFPVAASWVAAIPGGGSVPEPGAILLGMRDISSADGLDPASLRRALVPPRASALMQTLVPSAAPKAAPAGDLGRG